jgi:hypothetical protein
LRLEENLALLARLWAVTFSVLLILKNLMLDAFIMSLEI